MAAACPPRHNYSSLSWLRQVLSKANAAASFLQHNIYSSVTETIWLNNPKMKRAWSKGNKHSPGSLNTQVLSRVLILLCLAPQSSSNIRVKQM